METGWESWAIFACLVGFVTTIILIQKYGGRRHDQKSPPRDDAPKDEPKMSNNR
jgi:hypothetical protein